MHLLKLLNPMLNMWKQTLIPALKIHRIRQKEHLTIC